MCISLMISKQTYLDTVGLGPTVLLLISLRCIKTGFLNYKTFFNPPVALCTVHKRNVVRSMPRELRNAHRQ